VLVFKASAVMKQRINAGGPIRIEGVNGRVGSTG
jgi:hypothetical protein